jgi:16S rRNA (guanine966-N2)-methyltransferase
MRIVSGSARGRRLKAPPNNAKTRPMADKIKEALFSSLASFGVKPERVLDLYAGSGGVGIEALSRGAEWCDFVDQDRVAVQTIRENLTNTGFEDVGKVHLTSIQAFVTGVREPYDFVILDPPYADPAILDTLEWLSRSPAVMDGTIVVIGHWPRLELPDEIGQLSKLRGRCHGDSCFAIFDTLIPDAESDDA